MTEKPPPISGLVKKPEWLLGTGFFVKWLLDYEPIGVIRIMVGAVFPLF